MPRSVTTAKANVTLPNGATYATGKTVILTDAQWANISATAVSNGAITDNGQVSPTIWGGTKPTVTGAKASNAALGSLTAGLATAGVITDSTTT